ncbi:VOC family protein [Cellulomonas hominis]
MEVHPAQVTVDCSDPFALAGWWRERLGWREVYRVTERPHCVIEAVDGTPWRMCFIEVPDPTPGKNRLHLDFSCDDREVAAAELVAAGARRVSRGSMDSSGWIVLADPEGNVFCVSSQGVD